MADKDTVTLGAPEAGTAELLIRSNVLFGSARCKPGALSLYRMSFRTAI